MTEEQQARRFWQWFDRERNKYLFIHQMDEEERDRLLDALIDALHAYNENLFFEIGAPPQQEKAELIISAEGVEDYFPAVEQLVGLAPAFADWDIIAFKPALGAGFKMNYGGYEFDPSQIIFIPLYSEEKPDAIALRVCYPEYTEEEKDMFINGTYLMLDVILGERSTTLDIDYLEVVSTPENIGEYEFRHLDELQEFVDERKETRS